MISLRPWARSLHRSFLFAPLFAAVFAVVCAAVDVGCHKESSTPPVDDGPCTGARCVEEAEAAMYYKDYAKAREPLATVCEKDGFACFRLAELHQNGHGGPVDLVKAAALYEEACAKEYGEGCERRYVMAQESQADPAVELDYALKACDGGRPKGCLHAAEQIDAARGAERDVARVARTYEKACALGETAGCTGAGDLLSDPEGPADAKAKALTAFIKACIGHDGYGCLRVGVAFHEGIGTPQDLAKAKAHFIRACEWSDKDGCHAAEQMAASNGEPISLELTTKAPVVGEGGLEAREVSCRMSEQGLPALGEVLAAVARHKDALDACAKDGAAVAVSWEFEGGEVKAARVTDNAAKKLAKCVGWTMRKTKLRGSGTCDAVLLLGDSAGAAKALAARVVDPKNDGRKHVRVSADGEVEE